MLTRPCTSAPSMVKNLADWSAIGLRYVPYSSTVPNRPSSDSRGTRTDENHSRPLSTPLSPSFSPQSSIRTPGNGLPFASRIGTSSTWTPRGSPATSSWANTAAIRPCTAAFPM